MKHLIENKINKNNTLVINFEDLRILDYSEKTLKEFYECFERNLNPTAPIIFLDEIQKVQDWERWARTMHELKKTKIIVSGSSSKLINKEYDKKFI